MPEAVSSTPAEGRRQRLEQFAGELRRLRAGAGNPSFRAMAAESGTVSHTTLHDAAKGNRFPSWLTTRAFVEVCGGDVDDWRARWSAASGAGCAEGANGRARFAGQVENVAGGGPANEDIIEMPAATAWNRARTYVAASVVCGGLVVAGGATWYVLHARHERPGRSATVIEEKTPAEPLFAGDRSTFVADVTIPDGTAVKVGERFVKTWEIRNSGTVWWRGRFLQRVDLPADNGTCSTPGKVRVPETAPGHNVRISVPVVAPSRPGSCWVGWKMVNGRGEQFLPGARPVYFVVNVVE